LQPLDDLGKASRTMQAIDSKRVGFVKSRSTTKGRVTDRAGGRRAHPGLDHDGVSANQTGRASGGESRSLLQNSEARFDPLFA